MASIVELRERSDGLFNELLEAQVAPAEGPGTALGFAPAADAGTFSWFDPEQGVAAVALAFRLAALTASGDDARAGLEAALDHVAEEGKQSHPEQVRQGFALFVTHNQEGRRLAKPRTVAAAPGLFSPPPTGGDEKRRISIGGLSPQLDYWREDVLANEHHQHWHEVYPFTGLPPRDFREWLKERKAEELVAILNALQPNPGWGQFVATQSPEELARIFAELAGDEVIFRLPRDLYRLIFRLNDRQGELFFYMHEQMLARYDAELLSVGLDRVEPFGPDEWDEAIAAGYDPEEDHDFGPRDKGEQLPGTALERLTPMQEKLATAIAAGELEGANGNPVPIDRTNLGEAAEATIGQLHQLNARAYPGLHNSGHMRLAELSEPLGVMSNPVAAIRDQVFWQWHKFIDDISELWQETRDPFEFDDAPDVLLRNSLNGDPQEPWASPDVILCRTTDLPQGKDPAELGEELFGGDHWSEAPGGSGGAGGVKPVDELVTTMASANFGGNAIHFLTHEPFSYFIRAENRAAETLEVTARIFIAPADHAEDRRAWIEMDKFLVTLPARSKTVVHRPDSESSVIKRPVDHGPADVQSPNGTSDQGSYCDCGWPYTLLLPRGTADGAEYRLLVMLSDAAIDRVEAPAQCGSMSWCGAVDRYPDARDMGYPFCRPFSGGSSAIADTFTGLASAAGRTVTIRHA
jgi:Hemocyanin, ig-like domain/Hemocyanin, copper containing domain